LFEHPVVVGAKGLVGVVNPALSATEKRALKNSAAKLKQVAKKL
jgi:malate/lactate dehydrogenase